MIYTVTFNPALDYVIAVDHFTPGQINRTKEETMVCGGKGINVSALLANLGYESTALGFVAGFTGEEIVRRCQKAGFQMRRPRSTAWGRTSPEQMWSFCSNS